MSKQTKQYSGIPGNRIVGPLTPSQVIGCPRKRAPKSSLRERLRTFSVFVLFLSLNLSDLAGAATFTNPVGDTPVYMGDPFVFWHAGRYYLLGSTAVDKGFQCYESLDLVHWQLKGWAWCKTTNSWAVGAFWAPEVKFYRGKFYMSYSGLVRGSVPDQLRMALAVSDTAEGPYRDLYAPWFDPGYSTIDGHLFVDDDGTPYVYFSRNGTLDGCSFGMIYGVQLERDLSKPVGQPVKLLEASQPWERVNWAKNRCNEGATVLKHRGRYYMTYSANHTFLPDYGIGYATAEKPLGPWTKADENPILKTRLDLGVSAPGHNSIVRSPDGTELFIVYHSHADPKKPSDHRVVNIDRVEFTADGRIRVKGPTRSPQPLPSGAKGTTGAGCFRTFESEGRWWQMQRFADLESLAWTLVGCHCFVQTGKWIPVRRSFSRPRQ